jgi:hypothetical protein
LVLSLGELVINFRGHDRGKKAENNQDNNKLNERKPFLGSAAFRIHGHVLLLALSFLIRNSP